MTHTEVKIFTDNLSVNVSDASTSGPAPDPYLVIDGKCLLNIPELVLDVQTLENGDKVYTLQGKVPKLVAADTTKITRDTEKVAPPPTPDKTTSAYPLMKPKAENFIKKRKKSYGDGYHEDVVKTIDYYNGGTTMRHLVQNSPISGDDPEIHESLMADPKTGEMVLTPVKIFSIDPARNDGRRKLVVTLEPYNNNLET